MRLEQVVHRIDQMPLRINPLEAPQEKPAQPPSFFDLKFRRVHNHLVPGVDSWPLPASELAENQDFSISASSKSYHKESKKRLPRVSHIQCTTKSRKGFSIADSLVLQARLQRSKLLRKSDNTNGVKTSILQKLLQCSKSSYIQRTIAKRDQEPLWT